jgi:hypothetical protein
MAETTRDLVVVITHGADHELSSVAFTIANGGITAGLGFPFSSRAQPSISFASARST